LAYNIFTVMTLPVFWELGMNSRHAENCKVDGA